MKWQRAGLTGRFRNNPPVVDRDGRVYVAFGKTAVRASQPNGDNAVGRSTADKTFNSSPILADGTLYVGTTNGLVMAIGGCAS